MNLPLIAGIAALVMLGLILIIALSTRAMVAELAAEPSGQEYADAFAETFLRALVVADSHGNHEIYSDLVTVFGGYDALLKVADDHHKAHLLRNKKKGEGK